jgi:hypothetical protein
VRDRNAVALLSRYRDRVQRLLAAAEEGARTHPPLESLAYELSEELNADLLRLYGTDAALLTTLERTSLVPTLERLRDILRFRGRSPRSLHEVLKKARAELHQTLDAPH